MASRCFLFGLATLLVVQALSAADPRSSERGVPLLHDYPSSVHGGGSQNFDLAQDPAGFLYVANLEGLLIYDGAWWRLLSLPNELAVFCVESDDQGHVAVGGIGEIGVLEPDARGSVRFRSLLLELPEGEREIGEVWRIHSTRQGFVFLTDFALLRWDGTKMTRLASFDDPDAPVLSHGVDGAVLVWIPGKGLQRVEGDRLAPMPGGEAFRDRRVDVVLPGGNGAFLLSVRDEGLRLWDGATERPVAEAASRRLATTPGNRGALLPDGRAVIGTRGGGVLVLAPGGDDRWSLEMVIDGSAGLSDAFVHGMMVDHGQSLWLALDNGLTRVEIELPLTAFDERTGLEGSVLTVARHAGEMWVGTTGGLFRLRPGEETARMERVPGLPRDLTDPLDVDEELLVAVSSSGIFHGGPEGFEPVPGTEDLIVYGLARSPSDPDRVWLGLRTGVSSLRRIPDRGEGRWVLEPSVEGAPGYVTSFVERPDGTLWAGSIVAGVVRIDARTRTTVASGEGERSVHLVGGRILVADGETVLRLDEETGALVTDSSLEALQSPGEVFHLAEAGDGALWLNTIPPKVSRLGADGAFESPLALPSLPADNIQGIAVEPDGVVWMTTNRGLFRYAGGIDTLRLPAKTPRIRRIVRVGREDLFGGAPGAEASSSELPFRHGRLRFEYAPMTFRPGVQYQYRLDPTESEWSVWTGAAFTEFTQLSEGAYVFEVRSRHPGGAVSAAANWVFRVAPPWYRTAPAWLLWVSAALGLVLGYAQVRTARLRQRTTRLESLVSARTRELEAANRRLDAQSRRDDLTGLWNRRHLDESLQVEIRRALRARTALSFVLLDLDQFKAVNDALGHAAGDRCLRRFGAFLSERVTRGGDVVARYGGEEFALLLPGSDAEAAERFAGTLREALEELELGSEVGFEKPITASFGVAALGDGIQDESALVEAADDALYRAKEGGRNRVARASAGPGSGVSSAPVDP